MSEVPSALHAAVVQRAEYRCEYCQLAQIGQEATFHVDHVVPRAADGPTTLDNLALACVTCSLRKYARQFAVDPESRNTVPLFNPRTQVWTEHFQWHGATLLPLTATGRATAEGSNMGGGHCAVFAVGSAAHRTAEVAIAAARTTHDIADYEDNRIQDAAMAAQQASREKAIPRCQGR